MKIKVLAIMPIYRRELFVLNSIKSLLDYTEVDDRIEFKLALAINEMNDELKCYLDNLKSDKYSIKPYIFGENLGKGGAVNKVAQLEKYEFDYLVSIDSDMLCIDKHWLMKLLSIYRIYNRNPSLSSSKGVVKLGSLCTNHIGYNVHWCNESHMTIPVDKYTIITSPQNTGIGGGVLMTDVSTWTLLNGYNAKKLYGSDDGYYHYDCYKHNLLAGYVKEVSFYHPYEFNDEYRKWKSEIVSQRI